MSDAPDLRHYVDALRKQRYLIIATIVAVTAAAFGTALLQHKRYHATATIAYQTTTATTSPNAGSEDPARLGANLVSAAKVDQVIVPVAKKLGLTTQQMRATATVSQAADADLLDITVSASNAELAATGANLYATTFVTHQANLERADLRNLIAQTSGLIARISTQPSAATALSTLEQNLATYQAALQGANGGVTVQQQALTPSGPYTPHPFRTAVIGALVGVLLALVVALVRDRLDRRLHTIDEVEQVYGLPTLGVVPRIAAAARGDRAAALGDYGGASLLAEAYRAIRTNLSLFRLDRDSLRLVVISSAVPAEGKSAVTANLAAALASSGRRVLAISGDLRSPTLHQYFQARGGDGVIDVLSGEALLMDAVREMPLNGAVSSTRGVLALLSNERHFSDPAVLYQSRAMSKLLGEAREKYDIVLIDSPPVLSAGEASLLAQRADAVLIVSRLDHLTRDEARRTMQQLRAAEITPLGLIITGIDQDSEPYGYGYGYGSQSD